MPHDPLVGDRIQWEAHIGAAMAVDVTQVAAQTYRHSYHTASRPAVFTCDDGNVWVVKAQYAGRGVAADGALSAIGSALGAPVPATCRVRVDSALIAAEPELQGPGGGGSPWESGVWHGSLWIDGIHATVDRRDDIVRPGPHNADRLGRLGLLVAWCGLGDRQFVYEDDPPHLIHLVDMGHALPGANSWDAATLDAHTASAALPPDLWTGSGYGRAEAEGVLQGIGDPIRTIALAAARPLDHWGAVGMDDRVALAHYLSRQFDALRQTVAAL